jgi:hypothetical protein
MKELHVPLQFIIKNAGDKISLGPTQSAPTWNLIKRLKEIKSATPYEKRDATLYFLVIFPSFSADVSLSTHHWIFFFFF